MSKYLKIIIPVGALLFLGVVLYSPYHRWAKEHVFQMTATNDHPLKCTSCHLYLTRSGIISKIVNAHYYSPFNLAVSGDGRYIYVVAEEGNALLVVDALKERVIQKIDVGTRPHSIILGRDGNTAYVSN